jgi:hypothetical protein
MDYLGIDVIDPTNYYGMRFWNPDPGLIMILMIRSELVSFQ